MSVVIKVHNMRTESDASPARDATVLFSFLEFHVGCQLRLRIRALVAIYPQEPISKLADQQILDPVAVEIADKRRRVAYFRIDRLAGAASSLTGSASSADREMLAIAISPANTTTSALNMISPSLKEV